MDDLARPLAEGPVSLELLGEHHLDGLRAACAQDRDIWEIYPVNMLDDGFEEAIVAFHKFPNWVRFAVCNADADNEIVGMTNYINADPVNGVVEIGGTYIAPSVRGSGFNDVMKKLMIDHAFASGFRKIEFRIDGRNKRSQAAVLKLGALHEGTLRKNRVTWTGFIRDTEVFGLFEEEWKR